MERDTRPTTRRPKRLRRGLSNVIEDGEYAATIDEIEGERATVLLEADGELVAASEDAETTAARRRRRRARFDELAERPPGRDEDA